MSDPIAVELGRRGGNKTAERGPEYFARIAGMRKSRKGGRPRGATVAKSASVQPSAEIGQLPRPSTALVRVKYSSEYLRECFPVTSKHLARRGTVVGIVRRGNRLKVDWDDGVRTQIIAERLLEVIPLEAR